MIVYDNLWFLDEAGGFKPRLTTPDNEGFPLVNTGFPWRSIATDVKGMVWCGVEHAQKVVLCILYCHRYIEVSWNGWYPQLIHLNRIFHCKTIQLLGYPPFMETRPCSLRIGTAISTLAISVPSSGSTAKAASGWARSPIDLLGPNGPLLD